MVMQRQISGTGPNLYFGPGTPPGLGYFHFGGGTPAEALLQARFPAPENMCAQRAQFPSSSCCGVPSIPVFQSAAFKNECMYSV